MSFQVQDSKPQNHIIAVGTLGSMGALEHSKPDAARPDKTVYYWEGCEVAGAQKAPNQKFRLMWRPEWFDPKFRMATLDRGTGYVYSSTVASQDGTSLLKGLCGFEENWDTLQAQVSALGTYTPESVHEFLRKFYLQVGPVPFMYELRQERKKQVDGDGAVTYVRGRFMELHGLEWLTEKAVESLGKRITRLRERIAKVEEENAADPRNAKEVPVDLVVKFDPAAYGLDAVLPENEKPAWVTA